MLASSQRENLARVRFGGRNFCVFLRQLATLVDAGIDIISALETLAKQFEETVLGPILLDISFMVSSGNKISAAFGNYPLIFDRVVIAMVKIGEESGSLVSSLNKLADWKEQEYKLRQKIKSALAYPGFVVLVTSVSLLGLFGVAIPKFMGMFANTDRILPPSTRLLLGLSDLLKDPVFLLLLTVTVASALALWRRLWATETGRTRIFRFLHKLPLFGPLTILAGVSRFAAALEKLLEQGMPLRTVLGLAAESSGNPIMVAAGRSMTQHLDAGDSLSEYILSRTDIFPRSFGQYFATGEESARIGEMMRTANLLYEDDLTTKLESLVSLIEPLALAVVALVVGFVIIALASSTVVLFQ